MIRVACPKCSAEFSLVDEMVGKGYTCKSCQLRFRIPASESPERNDKPQQSDHPVRRETSEPRGKREQSGNRESQTSKQKPSGSTPSFQESDHTDIDPCPKCGVKLFVLRSDVGSDIECPDCGQIFRAREFHDAENISSAPARNDRSNPVDAEIRPDDPDEPEEREKKRTRRGARESRNHRDRRSDTPEPEEREEREDRDDPDVRPARKKLKRSQVQKIIVAAGIAMACVGALSVILTVVYAIGTLFVIGGAIGGGVSNSSQAGSRAVGAICGMVIFSCISVILGIQIFRSGNSFYSQADHHSAMMGAILCMIPCHAAFLLGLPVGIVSLIVLMRKDVKKVFG